MHDVLKPANVVISDRAVSAFEASVRQHSHTCWAPKSTDDQWILDVALYREDLLQGIIDRQAGRGCVQNLDGVTLESDTFKSHYEILSCNR